jgi:3',5'-cyclic AMP phosphodiesterase CpdA
LALKLVLLSGMFVLAHLSDPHLGPLPSPNPLELLSKRGLGFLNWLRKRRLIHRPEVLAALIADLKARAPDHIAVTGDLINLSLTSEFAPARAWLDRLGKPPQVTLVPGNHDSYVRAAVLLAGRHWADYMQGDAGEGFPFVRRRGPIALIGLSSSLPTLPLAATGRLHGDQLARVGALLSQLADEKLFRVVLIHHPPIVGANYFRRLSDAPLLRAVLREHGAELLLHGHHHEGTLNWLDGPDKRIPAVGVPSASGAPGHREAAAGYNLYEIDGVPGAWRCTMVNHGLRDGGMAEIGRQPLFH